MAFFTSNCINHFTHPGHQLTAMDQGHGRHQYICNGCKILGSGRRFRCDGCNFDLHEHCATCPQILSSFIHRVHALTLVEGHQDRICDVCGDPVAGVLSYQCRECRFVVHPLCTQLPERLSHALHSLHLLSLEFSPATGVCGVCSGVCGRWRYRCGACQFDIHLECVLVPIVPPPRQGPRNQRGVPLFSGREPFRPPPQFSNYYYYPYGHHPPPPPPGHVYGHGQHPAHNFNQIGTTTGMGRLGNIMFALVQQLGTGVLSNMIFGVDLSSL